MKKFTVLFLSCILIFSIVVLPETKVEAAVKYDYSGEYKGSVKVKTLASVTATLVIAAIPELAVYPRVAMELAKDIVANEAPGNKVYFTVKQYYGYTSTVTGKTKRTYIHSKRLVTFYKDSKRTKKITSTTLVQKKLHSVKTIK